MLKKILIILLILYIPFSYFNARNNAISNGIFYGQKYNDNGLCYANIYLYNISTFYPSDIYLFFTLDRHETFITIFTKDGHALATTAWDLFSHGYNYTEAITWWGNNTVEYVETGIGYKDLNVPNSQCGELIQI